jgi:hypothetical protein
VVAAADLGPDLPGEDRAHVSVDEARHWVEVYAELCQTVQKILRDTPAQELDDLVISRRLRQLELRRAIWEARLGDR